MASPQITQIAASLRDRLNQIDTELASFDALQSERARIAAALDALGDGSAPVTRPAKPRRSRGGPQAQLRGRGGRGGTQAAILGYLAEHPSSSASAIADALGLKRNSTSTCLTQMAKAGLIARSEGRGYELPAAETDPTPPRVSQPG